MAYCPFNCILCLSEAPLIVSVQLLIAFSFIVLLQNASAAYGTEFYVGAMRNYRGNTDEFLLYITTPSVSPVLFTIETSSGTFTSRSVTSSAPVTISLPTSLVTNNALYSSRFKGVYVYSTSGGLLSVLVVNIQDYTFGDYIAYPYQDLQLSQYQYYAVSTGTLATYDMSLSAVLLVGNEDYTTVTVISTQNVTIPINIQTNSGNRTITAGSSFSFTIHRMQTLLIGAPALDISGTSIISNKPLTVISGHECGNIPLVCCCQQITEQIPPTATWGKRFLVTPYATRNVGAYFKVVASESQTFLNFTCSSISRGILGLSASSAYLPLAGHVATLNAGTGSYCSIVSNHPILVTQLGPSYFAGNANGGDPVISLIAPIHQYQKNITVVIPSFETILNDYINIATTSKGPVTIDGKAVSLFWNNIYDSGSNIVGYGAQIQFTSGSSAASHTIIMQSGFGTLVYGFANFHGYSYSAGINIYELVNSKYLFRYCI